MNKDTLSIHGGVDYKNQNNSIVTPIYPTTAFSFDSVDHALDLFDLKQEGNIYSRISNPTVDVLEKRIALLEGGVASLAVASGQSATMIAVLNIASQGDEIIASSTLYGGTYNLFNVTFKKFGIKAHFVDDNDIDSYENAINDKTKCIFIETVGNPNLNISDIESIAEIAHNHNIPLIVDNTVATPYLCNPIEYGADIVVHSTTKYIGGHGNALGGVIVDSGNFDWEKSGKFHELTTPDNSYHGVIYTQDFGKTAYIVKARAQLLRDYGCTLSPFNAFLILQGIETLHLRMKRVSETALKLAQHLQNHPMINWVIYPGLEGYKNYDLTKKYMPDGQSSLVAFGIKGDGNKFIEGVEMLIHATNLGDARSILTYPFGTTHKQLSDQELQKAGITKDFMRLSVGLEDFDDIKEDIEKALKKANG